MQIIVNIDDGQLDALAELIVDKLLGVAPGLVDAASEDGTPALGQAAGGRALTKAGATRRRNAASGKRPTVVPESTASSKPKRDRTPAQKAAAARMVEANRAKRSPTAAPTSSAVQPGGYAGAVIDPLTGRHVEPGQTTLGPDEPAMPAPQPAE